MRAPALHPAMSPRQAGRVVTAACLRHFQANLAGAKAGVDHECLHQARVALRRLRCARKIFSARDADGDAAAADLKWLAGQLGQARDLDVLLVEALPAAEAAAGGGAGLGKLRQALAQRSERCRREAQAALESACCERLLSSCRHPQLEDADAKLRRFARRILRRRRRGLRRLAERWRTLDPEQLHQLRKQAKALRYAAEFFAPLFDAGAAARYLFRLQRVQDLLGAIHDAAAGRALLAQCGPAEDGELARAAGFVDGWLAQAAAQAGQRLGRALARLERAKRFW
ncbi:hypothetical protein AWB61_21150 [Chromobacterium sp. F49]|nr:hypothetical protein AWB61_21150 [Chromobacterium sp. F49]